MFTATACVRTNEPAERTNHASLSAEFASVCYLGEKSGTKRSKTRVFGAEMPTFGTMSSNLPTDPAEVITFVDARAVVWVENQPLIGSTPEEVAAVKEALVKAKEALAAANEARIAARSATQQYYLATERLRSRARVVVDNAKSLAKATDDTKVYAKAALNPPKPRARQAPLPGQPDGIDVDVNRVGTFTVRWTCKNPRGLHGVMYEVRRRIMSVTERNGKSIARWGPSVVVGIAGGEKKLIDATVPNGTGSLSYAVTALHNGRRGPASREASFVFGAAMPVASGTTAVPAKESQAVEPKMNGKPSLAA